LKTVIQKAGTLLAFLSEKYPESSRSRIKKILQSGRIMVNDNSVTLYSFRLNPGDEVEIASRSIKTPASELPFPVLYEDNEVIAVEKPAGYPTSSTDGSLSIQTIISETLKNLTKGKVRAHVVHRLDKEVSGVILFAKSHEAMDKLKDSWPQTEKHYYALVEGIPERSEDVIKSWLIEDKSQKVHSTAKTDNAKFSITHYRILKQIGNHTLLDVRTETGRKNQIRVHLSDIGCPIVGDRKYGASDEFVRRIRLHACSLSFPHPVTGRMITVKSGMPEGFLKLKPKNERYK
jgi:23S rRNA pseudouridine1911/1915/1917 synthase